MFPRSTQRVLQQQPPRHSDPQQQQAGSSDFQPKPAGSQQQMGEGSYEGSREYKERTEKYLKTHDVAADAEKAKPQSTEEARELEQAEEEGKSHSKGER
jgi:hypothetical protein